MFDHSICRCFLILAVSRELAFTNNDYVSIALCIYRRCIHLESFGIPTITVCWYCYNYQLCIVGFCYALIRDRCFYNCNIIAYSFVFVLLYSLSSRAVSVCSNLQALCVLLYNKICLRCYAPLISLFKSIFRFVAFVRCIAILLLKLLFMPVMALFTYVILC